MADAANVWWRDGVIYQVYPRSFQDTDADGVGDLKGILARLDYLVRLGVDALWVSPFYPSPMADFGYDVADYCGVDSLFGNMADFDALLAGAHARGLKLILDFVPNHTSSQHPWFLDSRSSRQSAKRDWYLWRDAAVVADVANGSPSDRGVPNNWQSNFGGPAWTWDEATGQYYLHSFLKEQPDLNWRNPAVRAAIFGAMRFWLDKGVDGFRMDVLWLLIKDELFRSNPPDGSQVFNANRPETLEIVKQMRALVDSYGGHRVLIGEIYLPVPELVAYYGFAKDASGMPQLLGAQMPFNFWLIQTDWKAQPIADLIARYEAALPAGAWPNWVLGNHDQQRLASRVGAAQARVAAMLLLTLRGTPTLYYGDELGMPDARVAAEDVVDPAEKNQPGQGRGRDPERSPMLWENKENAGFTAAGVKTWLPMVWDWPRFSVETEEHDARSSFALYKRLLAVRRGAAALIGGSISDVRAADGVLSFLRTLGNERIEVHLNLSDEVRWAECLCGRIVVSTWMDAEGMVVEGWVKLRENEGLVVRIFEI